jgi:RNase P subunit RPR2
LERVHFHVVSTRIDCETGKKIKDNYEQRKMQQFIKELEQKYQLTQKEVKEKPDFRFSPRSRNYKQNLENLFAHLNQITEITSKEMYNQALKIFNVEIKKSGRGHIVVVCDEIGNPIRYPIRLSNFKEKPRFYLLENQKLSIGKNENEYQPDSNTKFDKFKMAQLVRDLNRLVKRSREPDSKIKPRVQRKRKGIRHR